jgi:16S rRNA (guanine(966)-N(2))-methyltransferase RsmD
MNAPRVGVRPPAEVRLIGGAWKRSKLPVADKPGLRPTPDRLRETLFNWLGQDLSGWRCLDAFAGSGALGFEAASRGAAEVRLLERDRTLVRLLQASRERLRAERLQVECADALAWLAQPPPTPAARFDLVFLDPPFDAGLFAPTLRAVPRWLNEGGLVYLEAPEAWDDARLAPFGLRRIKHTRAGAVHAHLLQRDNLQP